MTKQLIELWTKAFGAEYIKHPATVRPLVKQLFIDYKRNLFKAKYKNKKQNKTEREILREWNSKNSTILSILKDNVDPQTDFDNDERIFYENQCLPERRGYISNKIDDQYEQSRISAIDPAELTEDDTNSHSEGDEEFVLDAAEQSILGLNDSAAMSMTSSTPHAETSIHQLSATRSGTLRSAAESIASTPRQTTMREGKRFSSEEAKSTVAWISTRAEISVEKARFG